MPRHDRRGFSLLELLLVMGVIVILATVMIPMFSAVLNAQRRAKATGEIAALVGGCERYRKLYGDFPCARVGTATSTATVDWPNFRRDFYAQLTGKQRLATAVTASGGVNLTLVNVTAGQERSIISPETVTAGLSSAGGATPADLSTADEFIDPWGNAYDYRYRVLGTTVATTGNTVTTPYTTWWSPDCLIVSCGARYIESKIAATPHVPLPIEYWDNNATFSMQTKGAIPTTYYDDLATGTTPYYRSDNITSFSGR